jgi:hypothetical protein
MDGAEFRSAERWKFLRVTTLHQCSLRSHLANDPLNEKELKRPPSVLVVEDEPLIPHGFIGVSTGLWLPRDRSRKRTGSNCPHPADRDPHRPFFHGRSDARSAKRVGSRKMDSREPSSNACHCGIGGTTRGGSRTVPRAALQRSSVTTLAPEALIASRLASTRSEIERSKRLSTSLKNGRGRGI